MHPLPVPISDLLQAPMIPTLPQCEINKQWLPLLQAVPNIPLTQFPETFPHKSAAP